MGTKEYRSLDDVSIWLGLVQGVIPEGVHGDKRGRLVKRHTSTSRAGAKPISLALAEAYPRNREERLSGYLRPRQLDDQFWRDVYALMLMAGGIYRPALVSYVRLVTSGDSARIQKGCVNIFRRWDQITLRNEAYRRAERE